MQTRCVQLLKLKGWFVLEMDRARKGNRKGAFHVGFVDILAIKGTHTLFIEFKLPTGNVRPEQHALHATLARQHGITVHVIRDETELLPHLKEPPR
ncbi:hypothetical protein [Deinococcus yavapaiensis]|uniref:VRR-NUC domain-containing protein n=1 Tax=Deinococcus yavapaiensis KR-236 TaxID=694435 RepID=A0A318S151_9DEIO|nr:hypothetical protein [Deinococcus yavapaiensis]PYE51045.1 hypothetical protein DES52_116112 [Deinococcus yavapaiensis KR-236]